MRLKLRGRAAININSRFNIDRLFYNQFTYELDELISFLFFDTIIIYKDLLTTLSQPFGGYRGMNLCFAAGYNYQDISMQIDQAFKFPNCYKMLIQSFCDWSQWTSIISQFGMGTKPFLFGLLDQCTMSDDAPTITMWSYHPI